MLTKLYSHILRESSIGDHDNGTTNSRKHTWSVGGSISHLALHLHVHSVAQVSVLFIQVYIVHHAMFQLQHKFKNFSKFTNRKERTMKLMSHFIQWESCNFPKNPKTSTSHNRVYQNTKITSLYNRTWAFGNLQKQEPQVCWWMENVCTYKYKF